MFFVFCPVFGFLEFFVLWAAVVSPLSLMAGGKRFPKIKVRREVKFSPFNVAPNFLKVSFFKKPLFGEI